MKAAKQLGMLFGISLTLAIVAAIPGAMPAFAADQDCLACHSDPTMKSESGKSLHVDPAKHKSSVHGDLGCTTCHVGVKEYPHPKNMKMPTCATCHDQEVAQVRKACTPSSEKMPAPVATGKSIKSSTPTNSSPSSAPLVTRCRSRLPARRSRHRPQGWRWKSPHLPCLPRRPASDRRRRRSQVARPSQQHSRYLRHVSRPENSDGVRRPKHAEFHSYEESVHGRAVANGSTKAAVCTDCHGVMKFAAPATTNPPSSSSTFP